MKFGFQYRLTFETVFTINQAPDRSALVAGVPLNNIQFDILATFLVLNLFHIPTELLSSLLLRIELSEELHILRAAHKIGFGLVEFRSPGLGDLWVVW